MDVGPGWDEAVNVGTREGVGVLVHVGCVVPGRVAVATDGVSVADGNGVVFRLGKVLVGADVDVSVGLKINVEVAV